MLIPKIINSNISEALAVISQSQEMVNKIDKYVSQINTPMLINARADAFENTVGDQLLGRVHTMIMASETLIRKQMHPSLRGLHSKVYNNIMRSGVSSSKGIPDIKSAIELIQWSTVYSKEAIPLLMSYAVLIAIASDGDIWATFCTKKNDPSTRRVVTYLDSLAASTTVRVLTHFVSQPNDLLANVKLNQYRQTVHNNAKDAVTTSSLRCYKATFSVQEDMLADTKIGALQGQVDLASKIDMSDRLTSSYAIEFMLQEAISAVLTYYAAAVASNDKEDQLSEEVSLMNIITCYYQDKLAELIAYIWARVKAKAVKEKQLHAFITSFTPKSFSSQALPEEVALLDAFVKKNVVIDFDRLDFFYPRDNVISAINNPIYKQLSAAGDQLVDNASYSWSEFIMQTPDMARIELLRQGFSVFPSLGDFILGGQIARSGKQYELVWAPGFIKLMSTATTSVLGLMAYQMSALQTNQLHGMTGLTTALLSDVNKLFNTQFTRFGQGDSNATVFDFATISTYSETISSDRQLENLLKTGSGDTNFYVKHLHTSLIKSGLINAFWGSDVHKTFSSDPVLLRFVQAIIFDDAGLTMYPLCGRFIEYCLSKDTREFSEYFDQLLADKQEAIIFDQITASLIFEMSTTVIKRDRSQAFQQDTYGKSVVGESTVTSLSQIINLLMTMSDDTIAVVKGEDRFDGIFYATPSGRVAESFIRLAIAVKLASALALSVNASSLLDMGNCFFHRKKRVVAFCRRKAFFVQMQTAYARQLFESDDPDIDGMPNDALHVTNRFIDSLAFHGQMEGMTYTHRMFAEVSASNVVRFASGDYTRLRVTDAHDIYRDFNESQKFAIIEPSSSQTSTDLYPGFFPNAVVPLELVEIPLDEVLTQNREREGKDKVCFSMIMFS